MFWKEEHNERRKNTTSLIATVNKQKKIAQQANFIYLVNK